MANRLDIENKVKNIISLQLGVAKENLDLSKGLIEVQGADSLDLMELIMVAEDEFGIEISDEDAQPVTTGQLLVDLVCRHLEIP